jgi:DNA-binding transcriptional regulator YiaG
MGQRKRKPPKALSYPSEKTQWAYWMQTIEPTSHAINQAFPGYHPLWLQQSQRMVISPASFLYLRRDLLNLNPCQTAAYLRVSRSTINAWEKGRNAIPFMAFELLRLVYESISNRLSHAQWDGWFIGKDGCFVSPDLGKLEVRPSDFSALIYTQAERDAVRNENRELRAAILAKSEENTRLRDLFVNQGVVDEIAHIRDRIGELFGQINTARIFQIRPTSKEA